MYLRNTVSWQLTGRGNNYTYAYITVQSTYTGIDIIIEQYRYRRLDSTTDGTYSTPLDTPQMRS